MSTEVSKKVVLSNLGLLRRKYGPAGVARIQQAVQELITRDAEPARNITTVFVPIDDPQTMTALGGAPVTAPLKKAQFYRQNKAAVDAVYQSLGRPHYVLLLGSDDVIPLQNLSNPLSAFEDPDIFAYGDLPYACDQPHSGSVEDFLSPTRVVGRLPDLECETHPADASPSTLRDPQYLIDLLGTAAQYVSRPRSAYEPHLGLSAQVWLASTELSVRNLFGPAGEVNAAPPTGPPWPPPLLGRLSHFINCHGALRDPKFYGESPAGFPVAHDAGQLSGVTTGVVAAAECCYGAELYDPEQVAGQAGICNTYLQKGAYGFLGSSTIAYGPAVGNKNADLLCQFFLRHVLDGKSLGHATLLARQEFIEDAHVSGGVIDAFELKTLAQFSLLGDPSIHPVQAPDTGERVAHLGRTGPALAGAASAGNVLRSIRRGLLRGAGLVAAKTARTALPESKNTSRRAIRNRLKVALEASGIEPAGKAAFRTFAVPAPKTGPKAVLATEGPTDVHIAFKKLPKPADLPFDRYVAVVGREVGNDLILRTLFSR